MTQERSSNPFGRDEEEAVGDDVVDESRERRMSAILNAPHMRSMRLIGNSNPRYKWERYWKTDEELAVMKKPMLVVTLGLDAVAVPGLLFFSLRRREYYERTNYLVQQYRYIDRLLDSSLPHDLLNEYNDMPASAFRGVEIPATVAEEHHLAGSPNGESAKPARKVKRTPKDIYRPTETTPLFSHRPDEDEYGATEEEAGNTEGRPKPEIPWLEDEQVDSDAPIVTLAIYVNFAANAILLAGKIAVVASVPSMSVLASLVDALLDFLSTVIVWVTTFLVSRQDHYRYPVGRRRLEPLGVLIFSVIMVTSFVQVALESLGRLASSNHEIIQLSVDLPLNLAICKLTTRSVALRLSPSC